MAFKILIGVGSFVIILILAILFSIQAAQKEPPPQIFANFTELDKIEKISRFRSCAGHTTVPQDRREMKRSMKHYFWVKKEFLGGDTVKIFSPYDGYVSSIRKDPSVGLEGEIWISPKGKFAFLPPVWVWNFSVQHINVLSSLKQGSEVKAGELIGYAAVSANNSDTFDVVVGKGSFKPQMIDNWWGPFGDLDSVFNNMADSVFAEYRNKGITSKEALIITKSERDAKPCSYKENGPYFLNQDDPDNWLVLLHD